MSPHQLEPVQQREAPTVEIARKLLAYLLSGEIRPGMRIPSERRLAEVLNVGRSSVRGALSPLLLLGIVESRQGDGTYLKRSDSRLLPEAVQWGLLLGEHSTSDLVEARAYIEVALAELAAIRRDDAALHAIRSHLAGMARAGDDREAFVEADLTFHLSIASASGNAALSGALASIQSLLRVWIARVISAASETRTSYEEHVPILEAIEDRDPSRSAAAMRVHLQLATDRLNGTLNSALSIGLPVEAGGSPPQAGKKALPRVKAPLKP